MKSRDPDVYRAVHKRKRNAKRPNALSIEALQDQADALAAWARQLPPRQRRPLVDLTSVVAAWLLERRNQMVTANLKLVGKMVTDRKDVLAAYAIPLEDAMQECAIGLMRAAELYDQRLGWAFSTYSVRWILQSIGRLITRNRFVSVPRYLFHSTAEVSDRQQRARQQALKMSRVCSLDEPLPNSDNVPFQAAPSTVEREEARLAVTELLPRLLQLERVVVDMICWRGLTTREVAEALFREGYLPRRVSKERVSQIWQQALRRLRQEV